MMPLALAVVLAVAGCGGGDDDGGGGGGGGPDAADPGADGGGGDFEAPAQGQFTAMEARFGAGDQFSAVGGTFLAPRPQYHELFAESGECRMWVYHVGACDDGCAGTGICDSEGTCIPYPAFVSAGDVTIDAPGGTTTLDDTEYGYVPSGGVPDGELFAPGDEVALSAPGGDDTDAFALSATGVAPIEIDLEAGGDSGEDSLVLEPGGDLTDTWDGQEGGARVRLELLTDNAGHGMPVREMIECESPDDGSITVPQAMIDALPAMAYRNICAGTDCPPSSVTRFTEDRKTVGDHDVALRAGFQQYFVLVINGG
jgi:hypothetical protein